MSRRLLFVGQDVDSIDDYVAAVGVVPGGVVGYTSFHEQEGIHSAADHGAGPNHLDYLAAAYPHSALAVGVWMKGQEQAVRDDASGSGVAGWVERMDALVASLAAYERPVYLRWGYEFDGAWNAYEPEPYKRAWVKAWERIRAKGARDRIRMVWQSAAYCGGTHGGRPIEAWYPGDQYVDWVGLSYFTPQDCGWTRVREVVDFAHAHDGPLMICESAPQRYQIADLTYSPNDDGTGRLPRTAQEIWDEWFAPYFDFIETNDVAAVTYINADWDEQRMWGPPYGAGYWGDSRVQANPLISTKWLDAITGAGCVNASPALLRKE